MVAVDTFDGEKWFETRKAEVVPSFVLPGGTGCFALSFYIGNIVEPRYNVRLEYRSTSLSVRPLLVQGVSTSEVNTLRISGQVRNGSDHMVYLDRVNATFYDENGHVIDCVKTDLSSQITADDTRYFSVGSRNAFGYTGEYSYKIDALAYPIPD